MKSVQALRCRQAPNGISQQLNFTSAGVAVDVKRARDEVLDEGQYSPKTACSGPTSTRRSATPVSDIVGRARKKAHMQTMQAVSHRIQNEVAVDMLGGDRKLPSSQDSRAKRARRFSATSPPRTRSATKNQKS